MLINKLVKLVNDNNAKNPLNTNVNTNLLIKWKLKC